MSWPSYHADKYLDARRPGWIEHEMQGRVRHEGGRVHVHPAADEIISMLAQGTTLLTER